MQDHPQIHNARIVIFDVDGTLYEARSLRRRMIVELLLHCLADPRRLNLLRILQVYRREREELADQEASNIIDQQYERPAKRLGISPREVETAIEPWIHQRPLRFLRDRRVPGVRRFFDRLRSSGRSLAILSDYSAEAKLEALGLTADEIAAATDAEVNRLKPHPAGLEVLLQRFNADPSDCVLFGDRDSRDGAAARRLNMPYLLRVAKVADPTTEFTDYRQFLDIVV